MTNVYHDITTKKEMDNLFNRAIDSAQNELKENAIANRSVINNEIDERFDFIKNLDIEIFFDHVKISMGDTNEDLENKKRELELVRKEFSENPYLSKYKIKDINEFKNEFRVYNRLIDGNLEKYRKGSFFFNGLGLSPFRYSVTPSSSYTSSRQFRSSIYKLLLKGNDLYARESSDDLYSYGDAKDIKVNIKNLDEENVKKYKKKFILDEIYMREVNDILDNKEYSRYISFENTIISELFDNYINLIKSIDEYIDIKKKYNGKRFLKEVEESKYVDKLINDNINLRTFELMKVPEHILNKFS